MDEHSPGLFGAGSMDTSGRGARSGFGLLGDRFAAHWLAFANSGFSDSTFVRSSHAHTRQIHRNGPMAVRELVFDWPNWACMPNEIDGPNAITVSAYLGVADAYHQLLWAASPVVRIVPGTTARNDVLDVVIPAGAAWSLTVSVTADNPGGAYPCNTVLLEAVGEGCFSAGSEIGDPLNIAADAAQPLPPGAFQCVPALPVYGPVAMRGQAGGGLRRILLLGDSIADGFADDRLLWPGFIRRALEGRFALQALTAAGDTICFLNIAAPRRARLIADCNATDCIHELGTNDLAGGIDFEWLRRETLVAWHWMLARSIRIHACTLMPRTTSLDGFTSLEGQIPMEYEAHRVAYNRWLRSGADGLITRCFDAAACVEAGASPGRWKVDGGVWTVDGVHPSPRGHAAAALSIDPSVFTGPS